MENNMILTRITLWINRVIFALLVLLIPTLPFLIRWFFDYRMLTAREMTVVLVAFYLCAVAVGLALWSMDQLLRNILKGIVFVWENVQLVRKIQWCCAIVSLLCIPASVAYLPLIFLVVIMGFLALVVCVVAQVMKAAVAIREENDLTI